MNKLYALAFSITIAASLTACRQDAEKGTEGGDSTVAVQPLAPTSKLSAPHTTLLLDMVNDYFQLKDGFVKMDVATIESSASRVMQTAENFNNELKSDADNFGALSNFLTVIMTSTEEIVNTKDETLEKKKLAFQQTSDAMYQLLNTAGVSNAGVYQQYCPMAFDDKGAYWLSNSEDIMNPYLPKKMLHCGEVKDTL